MYEHVRKESGVDLQQLKYTPEMVKAKGVALGLSGRMQT